MKYITTVITLLIIIIILFVSGLSVYNSEILRSTRMPIIIKSLVTMFFPPGDLYAPLVTKEFEVSSSSTLLFQNKYLGNHDISIVFDNIDSITHSEKIDLSFVVQCYIDNQLSFSKDVVHGVPFLGKDGNGFMLSTYRVPEDLPLDEVINCKISLSPIDKDKLTEYGKAKFLVRKYSDL